MTNKKIMIKKVAVKRLPSPKLQEISFSGNMASPYEKNLRKQLAKSKVRRKK